MTERPDETRSDEERDDDLEVNRETVKDLEPDQQGDDVRGGGHTARCAGEPS